eukprot:TRINITY_DN8787_c0_g1_i1.p1 TRINITY_DN8787_c0_g1~~TRINITY_DN8787_c0_g1_i1.p1  ORF type:complete len:251 (-),score=27.89 TRINITY_DN8787_c0_g1_i1:12-764(-)
MASSTLNSKYTGLYYSKPTTITSSKYGPADPYSNRRDSPLNPSYDPYGRSPLHKALTIDTSTEPRGYAEWNESRQLSSMSATNNTNTSHGMSATQTGKSATPGRGNNLSVGVSSTRYGNNMNNSNSKRTSPKKRTNTSLRQPSSNGHHSNNTSKSHSLDLDMSSGGDYGGGPDMSINRGVQLPPFDLTKRSSKKNGIVKAYAANTHQGLIRKYNEDRVSIILNIMRPTSCLLYTSPSPRDGLLSRMPSSA